MLDSFLYHTDAFDYVFKVICDGVKREKDLHLSVIILLSHSLSCTASDSPGYSAFIIQLPRLI